MIHPENITALILAGGRGSRMGGRDKGLLPFGEGLLVDHVLGAVRTQVAGVLISANRNQEHYRRLGCPVLGDSLDGFQGPLAGLLAGLENTHTDYLLTLPCDGPVVLPDLAGRLAKALWQTDARIAAAYDGGRLQPLYALHHREVLPGLRTALRQGERKVERWVTGNRWVQVDFSDAPEQFANLNTPDDYQRAAGSALPAVEDGPAS